MSLRSKWEELKVIFLTDGYRSRRFKRSFRDFNKLSRAEGCEPLPRREAWFRANLSNSWPPPDIDCGPFRREPDPEDV